MRSKALSRRGEGSRGLVGQGKLLSLLGLRKRERIGLDASEVLSDLRCPQGCASVEPVAKTVRQNGDRLMPLCSPLSRKPLGGLEEL